MFIYWFSIFTLCLSLFMEIQEQINNAILKLNNDWETKLNKSLKDMESRLLSVLDSRFAN